MKLKTLWSGFRKRTVAEERKMLCSVVLLLREPHFFTKEELEAAGDKAWNQRYTDEKESMYFVVQQHPVTLMKAGGYVMSVAQARRPYIDDAAFVAKQLTKEEQKKAWLAHTAWASLDLMNEDVDKPEAYAALARLAIHLGDSNCSGIYLPKEQMMMPNDGTAEQGLRFMVDQELPFN